MGARPSLGRPALTPRARARAGPAAAGAALRDAALLALAPMLAEPGFTAAHKRAAGTAGAVGLVVAETEHEAAHVRARVLCAPDAAGASRVRCVSAGGLLALLPPPLRAPAPPDAPPPALAVGGHAVGVVVCLLASHALPGSDTERVLARLLAAPPAARRPPADAPRPRVVLASAGGFTPSPPPTPPLPY